MRRAPSIIVALFAATIGVATVHCSSDAPSVFLVPGQCSASEACPTGQVCSNNACVTSSQSPVLPGFDNNGGMDASMPNDNSSSGTTCADVAVQFDKVMPEVRLLVDQSWSMQTNNYGGTTRWEALRTALMDPTAGVVKRLEGDVSFGLALYTYAPNDPSVALPPGVTPDATCPALVTTAAGVNNFNTMNALYKSSSPRGATPTGESILRLAGVNYDRSVVSGSWADTKTPGPKVIVLATDGDPNTCPGPWSVATDTGRQLSLDAVQRVYEKGIKTYVVAVGDGVSEAHQQAMANAGIGQAAGGKLYRPQTSGDLVTAFNDIIYGSRSCTFKLRGEVRAGTESKGRVSLDGRALGYNDLNGWRLNSPTEVELLGSSCSQIRTEATPNLSVVFPCGAIEIR